MKCPKCVRRLKPDAISCVCGWKSESFTQPVMTVDYGAVERERASHRRWLEAGSPTSTESIAKMKARMRTQKPTPREHWERVLRMPNPPRLAEEYARAALSRSTDVQVRVPGEDDEALDIAGQA
jgi:hypothetical protein